LIYRLLLGVYDAGVIGREWRYGSVPLVDTSGEKRQIHGGGVQEKRAFLPIFRYTSGEFRPRVGGGVLRYKW